jgi:hypothetical protein
MRTLSTSSLLALAVTSLAVSLVGCAEGLPPGTAFESAPPVAGPGEALVTFVRPVSTCDTGSYAVIVDDHGHFEGYLAAGTRIAVPVTPGTHAFYAWGNVDYHIDKEPSFNAVSAVRFKAVEGQDNYVALEVATPCVTGRTTFALRAPLHISMHAAHDQAGAGGDLDDMLASTKLVAVDRTAGQASLESRPAHLRAHLERGENALLRGDQERAREAQFQAIQREDATN